MTRSKRFRDKVEVTAQAKPSPNPKDKKQSKNATERNEASEEKDANTCSDAEMESIQKNEVLDDISLGTDKEETIDHTMANATNLSDLSQETENTDEETGKETSTEEENNKMDTSEGVHGKEPNPELPKPRNLAMTFDKEAPTNEAQAQETPMIFVWAEEGRFPPTANFKTIPQIFIDRAKKFSPSQIYPDDENSDTVHDLVRKAHAIIKQDIDIKEPNESHFMTLFLRALNSKAALSSTKEGKLMVSLGLRLAKSSPEIFKDCYDVEKGTLRQRRDTCAWKAANMVFGSHWTFERTPKTQPKKQKPKTSQTNLHQTAIRFSTETSEEKGKKSKKNEEDQGWTVVQTSRGLFRKKQALPKQEKEKNQTGMDTRKHSTYVKIRLPKVANAETADANATTAINSIVNALLKFDPRRVVYPWTKRFASQASSKTKPLVKPSCELSSKEMAELYVDRLFLSAGKFPYVRMRIGHDKAISDLEDMDHPTIQELKSKNIALYVEKIQAEDIATAGWFLGGHPTTFNTKSFLPVLQAHTLMKNLPLDLQIRSTRIDKNHKWSPKDPRAIHILCARNHLDKVKEALNQIYGSTSSKASMPMGRSLRFIPFTADPKGLAPLPDLKNKIRSAIRKQSRFIESTKVTELDGINDLDYAIKIAGSEIVCIREILQAMKASDYQTNLFLAIDEKWNGKISLTYHNSLDEQVQLVTSYLPLLLAEKFGPAAWKWFSEDTKTGLSGYYWDSEAGCVATLDNLKVAATLEGFDEFDDDSIEENEEMDLMQPMEINLDLQIDLEDTSDDARIVGDEDQSLATFGGHIKTNPLILPTKEDDSRTGQTNDITMKDRPEDVSTLTEETSTTTSPTAISTPSPSLQNQITPSIASDKTSGENE